MRSFFVRIISKYGAQIASTFHEKNIQPNPIYVGIILS